ncbi:hypothetical protein BDF22DRAFT_699876 [Syncephalis plumigaleata]|nr:hypothetical protein BDF22DRAFT_699876 [Syncephalis plumigaleata]
MATNVDLPNTIPALIERMAAEFRCPICLSTLREPYATPCQHVFCGQCITMALQVHECCPLCKGKVTRRALTPAEGTSELLQAYINMVQSYEHDTGEELPSQLFSQSVIRPMASFEVDSIPSSEPNDPMPSSPSTPTMPDLASIPVLIKNEVQITTNTNKNEVQEVVTTMDIKNELAPSVDSELTDIDDKLLDTPSSPSVLTRYHRVQLHATTPTTPRRISQLPSTPGSRRSVIAEQLDDMERSSGVVLALDSQSSITQLSSPVRSSLGFTTGMSSPPPAPPVFDIDTEDIDYLARLLPAMDADSLLDI